MGAWEWESSLTITVKVTVGTNISRACEELVGLSQRTLTWVKAEFNGVTLLASPDTNPMKLAARYHEELAGKRSIKIASARAC